MLSRIVLLLAFLTPFGCQCVTQTGKPVTTEFELEPFIGIASDNVDVDFQIGESAMSATGDEVVMPLLEVFVEEQILHVQLPKGVFVAGFNGDIRAAISNPSLSSISATDVSDFAGSVPPGDVLTVSVDDGATANLTGIRVEQVIATVNSGTLTLEGDVASLLSLECERSEAYLQSLIASDVDVNLSEAATAEVHAEFGITGSVTGGSFLLVSGNPLSNDVEVSEDSTMAVEL
jgi:hypothetical protein